MDEVIEHLGREGAAIMRAAAQLGQYLAYMQRERLSRLEQQSRLEAQRMREVMEMERQLAAPTYSQLTKDSFWEKSSINEIANAYGLAQRFSHLDPVAVIASREAERRAEDKWGVDLRSMRVPTEVLATLPVEAVPAVGEEIADHLRSEIARRDAEREQAQAVAAQQRLEEAEAAAAEVKSNSAWDAAWDRVVAEHPDASRREQMRLTQEALDVQATNAEWDTREARAAHTKEAVEAGASTQAARAALTADTSQSAPTRRAVNPKRRNQYATSNAAKQANTQTRRRIL